MELCFRSEIKQFCWGSRLSLFPPRYSVGHIFKSSCFQGDTKTYVSVRTSSMKNNPFISMFAFHYSNMQTILNVLSTRMTTWARRISKP